MRRCRLTSAAPTSSGCTTWQRRARRWTWPQRSVSQGALERAQAGGSGPLTARRAAWFASVTLLIVYAATLAPGVTFWDSGEFITAAHVLGIPHPPGTPLFVALGRVWTLTLGHVMGVALAMNLLSAVCTAAAAGITAWILARRAEASGESGGRRAWAALVATLCAGLATTAWANATETEVYAISLLHVALMLAAADRAGSRGPRQHRWLLLTAYLIALAPAVHLSALVGAPAAIALATRGHDGRWRWSHVALLGGMLVAAAGVGRMSAPLVALGCAAMFASAAFGHEDDRRPLLGAAAIGLLALAATAIVLLLVRARFDPPLNQGDPATWSALADVVARRQYEVAALWPRRAPLWLQFANVAQYADWQFALGWGRGIFTTPARVVVTLAYLVLGIVGWRALRRDERRIADAFAILVVCGTLGVCAYLNLEAGASIGYGLVPAGAHEARERDYFFILGFWGWAVFAGYGATAAVQTRRWPQWLALGAPLVPLLANWPVNDRARGPSATAARTVAVALLSSAPHGAMLFVAGDNDSYPLWYLQQVEGIRRDVTTVTLPLLAADWYVAEIARRTRLRWPRRAVVPGANWRHEETAASIAAAARHSGRSIAVSPSMEARERALLGSRWTLRGAVYVSAAPADGSRESPRIDPASAAAWRPAVFGPGRRRLPDDVSQMMLALLDCPRLGTLPAGPSAVRDTLEVTCNFR